MLRKQMEYELRYSIASKIKYDRLKIENSFRNADIFPLRRDSVAMFENVK